MFAFDRYRLRNFNLPVLAELTLISGLAVWMFYQKTLETGSILILSGMILGILFM